jgi:exopolyphosphatase / guanosine-5'-triphosphate,3'-diphosphate pyrophosphatase
MEGTGMVNAANFEKSMLTVDEISRTYDSDPGHNEQVASLALAFFDDLKPLHGYGASERRLLEIASRLHDIGWSKTVLKRHHKLSGQMILKMDIPGMDEREKAACALIARYHTKALPDASKQARFAALSPKRRELLEWLAGILRVADALDSSHTSVVKRLKLQINDGAVTVHLNTNGDCWDEIRRARRKEDLLVKKAGRTMVYQC